MPIVVKHRCGEVLAVVRGFLPMGDLLEEIHRKHRDKCPRCGGKLAWKPLRVEVRPVKRRRP